jgi:hypothetical protein
MNYYFGPSETHHKKHIKDEKKAKQLFILKINF